MGKENLVQKEVVVKRGGKTFVQKRWVSANHEHSEEHKKLLAKVKAQEESKTKDSERVGKLSDKDIAALRELQTQLEGIKPGQETKIKGVKVKAFKDGAYGFELHGKRAVAMGASSGALLFHGAMKLAASGGASSILGSETISPARTRSRVTLASSFTRLSVLPVNLAFDSSR